MLTQDILQDFTKTKLMLHGILVSAFTETGWRSKLWPVIEPRVPYSKSLDPSSYSALLKEKRKRDHVRLDVGFYWHGLLNIFAECMTIDSAHTWDSSAGKDWVSKRDLYLHFAQYAKPKASGLIICITLPCNVTRKPSWKELKQVGPNFFKELKPHWNQLANDLRQYIQTRLVVLEERGVHINSSFHPVSIPLTQ